MVVMRRYLYLITESEKHPEHVGNVEFTERQRAYSEKNVEHVQDYRNMETGETWQGWAVSLGFYDFEDEADYNENALRVAREKLSEVDDEHLEKAGLDPDEATA